CKYHIKWPNALWHIDGHHKLIWWGIVIHAFIDGFCQTVHTVDIGFSTNCSSSCSIRSLQYELVTTTALLLSSIYSRKPLQSMAHHPMHGVIVVVRILMLQCT
ncbi:hypothetical protein J3A83DRAFT_4086426, partial [Scleroderma citrinum]